MRPIEFAVEKSLNKVNAGPAPILQWVKITELVVDDTYQRDLKFGNWKAIRRIAAEFKWSRFSPVFVAPVEGGKFAIIDGQHRTHTAAMVGMAEVPCQIVQMDLEEQAAAFAAVNGLVTKVTLWNIYKAALAAGVDWARSCHRTCDDAGCKLMTSNKTADTKEAGEIFAIALIRQHVEAGRSALVTLALKGIRKSVFGQDAAAYANEILKPVLDAVTQRPWLAAQNADLSEFFDSFDIWKALDQAQEIARQKRRQGHIGTSRYDVASADIGAGLDKAFPQRMAMPKPTTRREVMDVIGSIAV